MTSAAVQSKLLEWLESILNHQTTAVLLQVVENVVIELQGYSHACLILSLSIYIGTQH